MKNDCTLPPTGWRCNGPEGHFGACAAEPQGWRKFYWMVRLNFWEVAKDYFAPLKSVGPLEGVVLWCIACITYGIIIGHATR